MVMKLIVNENIVSMPVLYFLEIYNPDAAADHPGQASAPNLLYLDCADDGGTDAALALAEIFFPAGSGHLNRDTTTASFSVLGDSHRCQCQFSVLRRSGGFLVLGCGLWIIIMGMGQIMAGTIGFLVTAVCWRQQR